MQQRGKEKNSYDKKKKKVKKEKKNKNVYICKRIKTRK